MARFRAKFEERNGQKQSQKKGLFPQDPISKNNLPPKDFTDETVEMSINTEIYGGNQSAYMRLEEGNKTQIRDKRSFSSSVCVEGQRYSLGGDAKSNEEVDGNLKDDALCERSKEDSSLMEPLSTWKKETSPKNNELQFSNIEVMKFSGSTDQSRNNSIGNAPILTMPRARLSNSQSKFLDKEMVGHDTHHSFDVDSTKQYHLPNINSQKNMNN